MTTQAAQLQFAAEFTLFIVSIAAISISVLRPGVLVTRRALRACFILGALLLAGGAFAHGSLLVDDATTPWLVGVRIGGIALIAIAGGSSGALASVRVATVVGAATLAASEAAIAADRESLADGVRLLGAAVFAIGLYVGSLRSIATRVAASAAAVVLLVITVLSLALSVVISDNVEDEVAGRYEARADTESQEFLDVSRAARVEAELLAQVLDGGRNAADVLAATGGDDPESADAAEARLAEQLAGFRDSLLRLPSPGPIVAVGPNGSTAAAIDASDLVRIELVGSSVVQQVLTTRAAVESVTVVGDLALAIGAAPVTADGRFLGVAVVTNRLDEVFLRDRIGDPASIEQGVGLALADRTRVFSTAGSQSSLDAALTLAGNALRERTRQTVVDGDRFVVAVPVSVDQGNTVLAVLVTVPQDRIDATREDLFRLLFLVALGAALIAVVLAGYVGNRIGSGLEQLTSVAGELQEGRFSARANLDTEDELGVLGSTFNTMAYSLESMTNDLRSSAAQEAALRARLEGVVGGMGEALIAVGENGRITDFNAAAEELTGWTARNAIGSTVADVCTIVDADGDITASFEQPVVEAWSGAAEVVGTTGRVPVAVSAGPLRDGSGALNGAVFVLRDMRREREIEQMKSEIIAGISHELRTPLTPIMGYSELLATREVDPDRTKQFALEIQAGGRTLKRVVDRLVHFAGLAGNRIELRREDVAARSLLNEMADRWDGQLPDTHRLVKRVARGTPPAQLDREFLSLALDELVDNAVKFSPDGGRIRVTASAHDNGHGPQLQLAVDDQGIGIEADRREVIFEDFAQGGGWDTNRVNSLGLGLPLVDRIVRAHGGELSCTSEVGKGTTVLIRLPLTADEETST